ncbi:MAG: DUF5662 family protein [Lachnospiraceae bacterium]|nr:DUF5662 family protein [Lachnospiraceae bacterium]
MNFWGHLRTINHHKWLVMKACFRVGLYRQGLLHDLSKYSPAEFWVGVKYYRGNMSPNNIERREKGYTSAWLHHKGRNKHHLEYWIDYGSKDSEFPLEGMRMPDKYVVEMFIDRMSASKNYQKDAYTDRSALDYYMKGKARHVLHPEVKELLERLLTMLAEEGEDATFAYIRREVLGKRNN